MAGPMGRAPRGVKPNVKNPGKTFKRLMSYVFRKYKWHYIIVIALICVGVLASVQGTMFQKSLIDDYIKPMLLADNPDFSGSDGKGCRILFAGCCFNICLQPHYD